MTTLHIVNHGPSDSSALVRCLKSTNPGDALLLIDDAVCAVVRGSEGAQLLAALGRELAVYVLKPSLCERGLLKEPLITGVEAIEFEGFVDLTVSFDTSVSWG